MPFQGNPMPGQAPMGMPMNPMRGFQRDAVLRGGPNGVGGGMPMPMQPMPAPPMPMQPGVGGLPNQPMPMQQPRPPMPGPMGGPQQNLWSGPQGY